MAGKKRQPEPQYTMKIISDTERSQLEKVINEDKEALHLLGAYGLYEIEASKYREPTWACYYGDKLVGYINACVSAERKVIDIDGVYVVKEQREKGCLAFMLGFVEEYAKQLGYVYAIRAGVFYQNTVMKSCLHHLGYSEDGYRLTTAYKGNEKIHLTFWAKEIKEYKIVLRPDKIITKPLI